MKRDVEQAIRTVEPGATPDSFRAVLVCEPELRVFQGHFPGNPIVPGVMELEMLRTAYERFTRQRWAIARVIKAKFKARILPCDEVKIEAVTEPWDGGKRIRADFRNDDVKLARIILLLRPS